MAQDDDTLTGLVPEPDAEPTPAELAHARRFAELVDQTRSGRAPAAISADDRALLEVATVIRATHGGLELSASRQRQVVEDALRQAIGAAPERGGVTPISRARSRRWALFRSVAMLWLRAPKLKLVGRAVPVEWTSRSADALIGPIARDHAGDALSRIDTIFADRLDGFRARRLTRGGTP